MKKKASKEKNGKKIPPKKEKKIEEPEETKDIVDPNKIIEEEEVDEIIPKVLSGDEELDPMEALDAEDEEETYNPMEDYEDEKGF